jgi:tRNA-dihydrouridine synthase A
MRDVNHLFIATCNRYRHRPLTGHLGCRAGNINNMSDYRFSVAPMMDWTDRHCRYFLRQISRRARLYSEMVATDALLRGNPARWLAFHREEHPLALQLGGSDPRELAACARLGARFGYDEINLNLGCPSDRVRSGRFGACLMAEPDRVAGCIAAMNAVVIAPVTVKTRIGIDNRDSYPALGAFVERLADAGCRIFIVHARKAILKGLSPGENRRIPPLRYDVVYRLKCDFPELTIVLNGGITRLDEVDVHLRCVDGVMLGRAAYHNPYLLAGVDARLFGDARPPVTRAAIVARMLPYIEQERLAGTPLNAIVRHMLGLFQGVPGARAWRRYLSEHAHTKGAGPEVILAALARVARVDGEAAAGEGTISSLPVHGVPLPLRTASRVARRDG